jgi:hypothetical protein
MERPGDPKAARAVDDVLDWADPLLFAEELARRRSEPATGIGAAFDRLRRLAGRGGRT